MEQITDDSLDDLTDILLDIRRMMEVIMADLEALRAK